MQIRQLEYFLSLCDTLNFTRTAGEFYVSQTAVTQAIKALEAELETPLFIRTKRNVSLTPAGELLREDAKIILQQIAVAEARVRTAAADMTGSLRIGFAAGYEHEGLIEALHAFHTIYPEVKLSFEAKRGDVLWRKLEADGLDAIFTFLFRGIPDDCAAWSVRRYPLLAVFRQEHPLASLEMLRAQDLASYPCVAYKAKEETELHTAVEHFFMKAGFHPKVAFASDSTEVNLVAVGAGFGYLLLPGFIADRILPGSSLVTRRIIGYEEEITIGVVRKKDNDDPLLRRFLEICMTTLHR